MGILKNDPFVEENFSLDNVPSGCTRVVLPMLYNGVIRLFLDVFCPYKDLILIHLILCFWVVKHLKSFR